MATLKVTGDPALDLVIGSLTKTFSKEFITLGPSRAKVNPIPTGSIALDMAIGLGGIPQGRVIEIFGPESSGKTSLALCMANQYERIKADLGQDDRWVLIVDLEHTITLDLITKIGLDPSKLIWVSPDTAEEAFQTMLDMTKTEKIGFAILDSVDAAQSQAQLKKKIGENEMGGISKIMSKFCREYSKLCEKTDTTAIFINQIRMNPGQMFGSPIVTPGGKALGFYSSLRLSTMPNKESANMSDAFLMRVKIIKNKVRPPRKDPVAFDFRYAKGPEPIWDLIYAAKDQGVIRFAGPSCKVQWEPTGDSITLSSGGKVGLHATLSTDPALEAKLRKACYVKAGILEETNANSSNSTQSASAQP